MARGRLANLPFWLALAIATGVYVAFVLAILAATALYTTPDRLWRALESREIRYSISLSLITCTLSALLSLALAVPAGYLLARGRFRGRSFVEALIDIPIVLPPMVLGLCLLIFFQTAAGHIIEQAVPF